MIIWSHKERHYILIKGSIQEEDIAVINIYASNTGTPQYIRQTLTTIKGEIDSDKITAGDFKTPLTTMDRSSGQKINKETQALNHTCIRLDGPNWCLWDIPSQNSSVYFFLKCVWNILQDRSHLGSQIKSQQI